MTLVVSWPEQGIPETRGELDGTAVRAAAQRAVVRWPDEPELGSGGTWQTIIAEAPDEGAAVVPASGRDPADGET